MTLVVGAILYSSTIPGCIIILVTETKVAVEIKMAWAPVLVVGWSKVVTTF